jgi:Tfp pilus assembly protein PilF
VTLYTGNNRRGGRWAITALSLLVAACSSSSHGPYEPNGEGDRNALRAQELTARAIDAADQDAAKSETLLRDALTADLYYGPAHNDLGVLFFRQGKLYEAANEFEWARKLMPGHPDPRLNLALTLERAGHVAEAFAAYDAALEVAPEHVPTMQAYAKLAVRRGRHDERVAAMLKSIALRGEDTAWREWAQREQARAGTE